MNKVIEQTIFFKDASPEELFDIILDAKKHSEILGGAAVKITKNEGDPFSCLNGLLKGKNLMIVPNRMIVQSLRGDVWDDDELDSVLTLVFTSVKVVRKSIWFIPIPLMNSLNARMKSIGNR